MHEQRRCERGRDLSTMFDLCWEKSSVETTVASVLTVFIR